MNNNTSTHFCSPLNLTWLAGGARMRKETINKKKHTRMYDDTWCLQQQQQQQQVSVVVHYNFTKAFKK